MLNILDITVFEVILFENLKRTAERITDYEELCDRGRKLRRGKGRDAEKVHTK